MPPKSIQWRGWSASRYCLFSLIMFSPHSIMVTSDNNVPKVRLGKIQGDGRKFLDRFKSYFGSQISSHSLNEIHIHRLKPKSATKGDFFIYFCLWLSDFNVLLILRDKATRQSPQTTTFLKKKESRSGIEPRPFCLSAKQTPYHEAKLALNLFEEKGELKWYQAKALLLPSLMPYH